MFRYVAGVIILLMIAGGVWYVLQQQSPASTQHPSGGKVRTGYEGTAKIEPVSQDELILRLEEFGCRKTPAGTGKCQYWIDEKTGKLHVRQFGSFGPSGFSVIGDTLGIYLDLIGGKDVKKFEAGVEDVITEYGNVVSLKKGTLKISRTEDRTGAVY